MVKKVKKIQPKEKRKQKSGYKICRFLFIMQIVLTVKTNMKRPEGEKKSTHIDRQ